MHETHQFHGESALLLGRPVFSDLTYKYYCTVHLPWSRPDFLIYLYLQNSLVVEIPPFRNQRITSPVQVNFYVCNGKRKRSQYQLFTYLPANGNKICSLLSISKNKR